MACSPKQGLLIGHTAGPVFFSFWCMVLKRTPKERKTASIDHLKLLIDSYGSYTSYRSKVRAVREVRISCSLFASATSLPLLPKRQVPLQCVHWSIHLFLIQRPSF